MATPVADIVVAIDFGTTASGIGYSILSLGIKDTFPDIIIQDDTDTLHKTEPGKTPSVLAYVEENPNISEDTWGFDAGKHPNVISWLKLFLDDDVDIDNWILETKDWAQSRGIIRLPDVQTKIDVLSDYLSFLRTALWERLQSLETHCGKDLSKDSIKFCFTVPGTWSDEAIHDMGVAIGQAGFNSRGFDHICFLTEAKAAMKFALSGLGLDDGWFNLKTGDGVVICDCGGGTVDVASFLISKHNRFIFDELAQSSGELCGSTLIDREFYTLMRGRFGDAFSGLSLKQIGPHSTFMKDFQDIKCGFNGHSKPGHFKLDLSMAIPEYVNPEWYDQGESKVLLSNADLHKLFQPAVRMTIQTLVNHISKANRANGAKQYVEVINILLVGGFSHLTYLCNEIENSFPGIPVISNPAYALTAVTRGAILWGTGRFEQQSMASPCHYGFQRFLPIDGAFSLTSSLIEAKFNLEVSKSPIQWMVKKGDRLRLNEPVQCSGLLLHTEGESFIKTVDVYSSARRYPRVTIQNSGASKIQTMVLNLSDFAGDCLRFERGGRWMRLIKCTFQIQLGDTQGTVYFDVFCEGCQLAHWEFKPIIV